MSAKPVLYTFGPSVWASAPSLAITELGYAPGAIEEKTVNLMKGENFNPDFVKININATLPTLTANGKVYENTKEVVDYLISHAPTPYPSSKVPGVIDAVHRDDIDPNFSFLSATSQFELDAKRPNVAGFANGRQAALTAFAPLAPPELKSFYEGKLALNGWLVGVWTEGASAETVEPFFSKSKDHWATVKAFLQKELPDYLPASGFVDGSKPGEADFHVAAWLARTAAVTGSSTDDITPLGKAVGITLDKKLVAYFNAWKARESFKKLYAEGLH